MCGLRVFIKNVERMKKAGGNFYRRATDILKGIITIIASHHPFIDTSQAK